jgi:hypothetical protein
VPASKHEARQPARGEEDDDAENRNEEQGREHARDLVAEAGFQNARGETRVLAGGARDELGTTAPISARPPAIFSAAMK